jgi:hypothetical protein
MTAENSNRAISKVKQKSNSKTMLWITQKRTEIITGNSK